MTKGYVGRFWLVQRVRDDWNLYGKIGTYYLLREDYPVFTTLYVMYVANKINQHKEKQYESRI